MSANDPNRTSRFLIIMFDLPLNGFVKSYSPLLNDLQVSLTLTSGLISRGRVTFPSQVGRHIQNNIQCYQHLDNEEKKQPLRISN